MTWRLIIILALIVCAPSCKDHDDHDHDTQHGEDKHDDHDHDKERDDHDDEHHDDHDTKDGHDDEEHHDEEVHLSASAIERSGVRVGTVATGELGGSIAVPAEIQLNPDRVAHISPLVEGQLLSVDVTIGDRVKAKQNLARLRSIALGQARAALSRTTSLRSVAKQHLEREKRLRAEGINSEHSLLKAQFALDEANAEREAALSRLRIFDARGGWGPDMALSSPIDGVIIERHATRGENVSPDDTIFVVADLSRVWVIGQVYERQIGQVKPGMRASLTLNAYPGRTWTGTVDYLEASLNTETRTLPIRVELNNPDGFLRPGLFGSLALSVAQEAQAAVVVPLSALQTIEDRTVVFVPGDKPGTFEMRPVTLGRSGQDRAEVLEGLKAGDSVVLEGSFVLKSELMRAQLGHGHAH